MPTDSSRSRKPKVNSGPVVKPFHVKWPATSLLHQMLEQRSYSHLTARTNPEPDMKPLHTLTPAACTMHDTTGNPVPLGLAGLGMSILLLNLHFAGLFPLDAMILGTGTFCGGIEQVMVGIMAWKKNNIFAATAFTSYGLFWLSLVSLTITSAAGITTAASPVAMGFYLSIWALFTSAIFLASFRRCRALQAVFGLLLIFFILLAAGSVTSSAALIHIAGYAGILSGVSALYAGLGQVVNELFHRSVMPLGTHNPQT